MVYAAKKELIFLICIVIFVIELKDTGCIC